MKKFSRLSACLAATGLLTAAAVTGSAVAANAGTVASCAARGDNANCATGGTASHPITITVTVTTSPRQSVVVGWDVECTQGGTTKKATGTFTAMTPVTRTLPHAFRQPPSCIVAAASGVVGNGSVRVVLSSSATAPVHEIRGYADMCVNDKGNSTALRNKIEIWKCNGAASEQWSLSRGKLIHRGMCANAKGAAGSPVVENKCNGSANELWTHNSKGEYVLKARGAHGGTLCLTDPGFSKKNRTALVVSACRNGANQHWTIP